MALTVSKEGNPIKVTGTTSSAEAIITKKSYVKFIYWLKPSTEGHLLTLKNKDGGEIAALRCETDDESQVFPIVSQVPDLYCDDMDSGTLYIYIK